MSEFQTKLHSVPSGGFLTDRDKDKKPILDVRELGIDFGGLAAVDTMNHFLLNKEVIVVGSTYWNMAYGRDAGDVLNDAEGMANMRNLGQNMAFVLKKIR